MDFAGGGYFTRFYDETLSNCINAEPFLPHLEEIKRGAVEEVRADNGGVLPTSEDEYQRQYKVAYYRLYKDLYPDEYDSYYNFIYELEPIILNCTAEMLRAPGVGDYLRALSMAEAMICVMATYLLAFKGLIGIDYCKCHDDDLIRDLRAFMDSALKTNGAELSPEEEYRLYLNREDASEFDFSRYTAEQLREMSKSLREIIVRRIAEFEIRIFNMVNCVVCPATLKHYAL